MSEEMDIMLDIMGIENMEGMTKTELNDLRDMESRLIAFEEEYYDIIETLKEYREKCKSQQVQQMLKDTETLFTEGDWCRAISLCQDIIFGNE